MNEHNAPIPSDFWLDDWERQAIIQFYLDNPLEGYRRLTFMMLDQDIVAVSPSTICRVLTKAELLKKWNNKKSIKETGFVQPLMPHEHWHADVSYIQPQEPNQNAHIVRFNRIYREEVLSVYFFQSQ